MKNLKQNIIKTISILVIIILTKADLRAECNISTPIDQHRNPGSSFSFSVNFHPQGGNLRRASIVSETGFNINTYNVHIEGVGEINGNSTSAWMPQVLGAESFHISGGNHDMTVNGFIPNGTGCGLVATFKVKIEKRDAWIWWNECDQIFHVYTNSDGTITVAGPQQTCGILEAGLTINGTSATQYVWTSTNPSFTLNGSSNWPITTSSTDATLQATIPGSSTTLQVAATGPSICGTAISTFDFQSIHYPLELSGAPHTCNPTGSSITVQGTYYANAIYTWRYKQEGTTNWSSPVSTTSNQYAIASPSEAGNYLVKCAIALNGCSSRSDNVLDIRWCENNHPTIARACCIKQVPTEKNKAMSRVAIAPTLKAKPVPSSNVVSIEGSGKIGKVLVLNHMGLTVLALDAGETSQFKIDISQLKNGIYFVKAMIEGKITTVKIVKS